MPGVRTTNATATGVVGMDVVAMDVTRIGAWGRRP